MCTQYSVEKISAHSIARVAYARTRARNGCRRPLRGIFPLRVRGDLTEDGRTALPRIPELRVAQAAAVRIVSKYV
jgi:hypothetical protein